MGYMKIFDDKGESRWVRTGTDEERFWSKVKKSDSCWLWTGATSKDRGYGSFSLRGKSILAHRVAWILTHGEIPDGLVVMHKCDTRNCVRPDHLMLGLQDDNVQDMIAKKRKRRGSSAPGSILSDWQVEEIRAEYAKGGISQAELGRVYGVSQVVISRIVRGLTYSPDDEESDVLILRARVKSLIAENQRLRRALQHYPALST